MSSALYHGEFVTRQEAVVQMRLEIVHRDVSEVGSGRLFAWRLLSGWVSPEEDDDEGTLALRYIKRVELSPVENGTLELAGPGFVRVKRLDGADEGGGPYPFVIYTIEVTDAALLDGIKVGDRADLYTLIDPDPSAPKKAAKKAAKAKASKAPIALPPKTFDDFRRSTFAEIAKASNLNGWWADDLISLIVPWSQQATDEQVINWLECLDQPMREKYPDGDSGFRSRGAALVAIERANAGNCESANRFLAFAEGALPRKYKEPAYDEYSVALCGLVPAWWRLGKQAAGDLGYERLRQAMVQRGSHGTFLLAGLNVLGGRTDLVREMLPTLFSDLYRSDFLVAGLLSLLTQGDTATAGALLAGWNDAKGKSGTDDSLSLAILTHVIRQGTPELYLDFMFRFPNLFQSHSFAEQALFEIARKNSTASVVWAQRILATPQPYGARRALAVLSRHSPSAADAWRAKMPERTTELGLGRFAYFAALDDNVAAREGLAVIRQSTEPHGFYQFVNIAEATRDRSLAIAAMKAFVEHPDFDADRRGYLLPRLVALGERELAAECCTKYLNVLKKMAPKERKSASEQFAKSAGRMGFAELGKSVVRLAPASARDYVARSHLEGCAIAGDWTCAAAALELIEQGERLQAAILALKTADRGFRCEPDIIPLRALE